MGIRGYILRLFDNFWGTYTLSGRSSAGEGKWLVKLGRRLRPVTQQIKPLLHNGCSPPVKNRKLMPHEPIVPPQILGRNTAQAHAMP